MEKLTSLEQYYNYIKDSKKRCRISFSNMYCLPDEIERYIALGRMYVEELDGGLAFFLDEETYYKLCLSIDANASIQIPKVDRKVLCRYIYRENGLSELMNGINTQLIKNGFARVGKAIQIQGNPEDLLSKKKSIERGISILNRNGFYICRAGENMIDEIEKLIESTKHIQDFHSDYRTLEEKRENAVSGGYLCVVDKEEKLCAATVTWVKGSNANGDAIVVKDEYKRLGLAPVLCYERMKYLQEYGVKKFTGWVQTDNELSLRYHKSMEFQLGDRYADEWLKEV